MNFIFLVWIAGVVGVSAVNSKLVWNSLNSHDARCYTQGLQFLNSTHVLQSCGMYGQSYFHIYEYRPVGSSSSQFKLREVWKSSVPFDSSVFLEGSTVLPSNGFMYMLTWQQNKVYKINLSTTPPNHVQSVLRWDSQGWGLTHNDTHMFVSDGSAKIYVVDQDFSILEQKDIIGENNQPVVNLNELEYAIIDDQPYIFANVYTTTRIVKIDYSTGRVVKEYDGSALLQNEYRTGRNVDVLNGIAWIGQYADQSTDGITQNTFLLTGKYWRNVYKVDLI